MRECYDTELDHQIALEVMGWHQHQHEISGNVWAWEHDGDPHYWAYFVHDWKPTIEYEHAELAALHVSDGCGYVVERLPVCDDVLYAATVKWGPGVEDYQECTCDRLSEALAEAALYAARAKKEALKW